MSSESGVGSVELIRGYFIDCVFDLFINPLTRYLWPVSLLADRLPDKQFWSYLLDKYRFWFHNSCIDTKMSENHIHISNLYVLNNVI